MSDQYQTYLRELEKLYSKISKKNALYQGEAIIDEKTMLNAGSWWLGMNQCEGKFSKKWRQELAKLSWEDFRNFGQGISKFAQGYVVTDCGNKKYSDVSEIIEEVKQDNYRIQFPDFKFCTDNAAMIAMAGYLKFKNNYVCNEDILPLPNLNF